MTVVVLTKCRECGHTLIAHGPARGGSAVPQRICWQCTEYGGPCTWQLEEPK